MSFSTLMVHLDVDQPNNARLRAAGALAERFDARVIGIGAGDIQPLYFMEGVAGQEMLDQDRSRLQSKIDAAEQQFREAFKGRGDRIEWRSALERPADFVVGEARAADLIIASAQTDGLNLLLQVSPGELVLRAGRPVLAVPPGSEWLGFSNMMVAWKDTREARRAINDALPLLHKASEVAVVEVVEGRSDLAAARARVEDVATWLVRRGIPAAAVAAKAVVGVPEQLVTIAKNEGADIVVAGAYGHTRLREWILGGVTRELLMQPNICTLLSH